MKRLVETGIQVRILSENQFFSDDIIAIYTVEVDPKASIVICFNKRTSMVSNICEPRYSISGIQYLTARKSMARKEEGFESITFSYLGH